MITKPLPAPGRDAAQHQPSCRKVALLHCGPFWETDRAQVSHSRHPAHCTEPEREMGAGQGAAGRPQPRARLEPQDQTLPPSPSVGVPPLLSPPAMPSSAQWGRPRGHEQLSPSAQSEELPLHWTFGAKAGPVPVDLTGGSSCSWSGWLSEEDYWKGSRMKSCRDGSVWREDGSRGCSRTSGPVMETATIPGPG